MHPRDLVIALVAGSVAIAFGMIPGLFQWLSEGIQNLSNSLSSPFPMSRPHHRGPYEYHSRQPWLVAIGFAVIIIGCLGYLYR